MPRTEMTSQQLDAWLAENVMGWTITAIDEPDDDRIVVFDGDKPIRIGCFAPTTDRNDLAEVLAKLDGRQLQRVSALVLAEINTVLHAKLLTADPAIVCRAIYEAMTQ